MFQVTSQIKSQICHEKECVNKFSTKSRHSDARILGKITHDVISEVAVRV